MEHRCQHRLPVNLAVELSRGSERLGCSRVRNLSVEGMFIEAYETPLRECDFLEAQILTRTSQAGQPLKGIVCHASAEGVGIMFSEPMQDIHERLQSLDLAA